MQDCASISNAEFILQPNGSNDDFDSDEKLRFVFTLMALFILINYAMLFKWNK